MEQLDIRTNHLLTVELSSELYAALLEKVKITGETESELIAKGLRHILAKSDRKSDLEIEQDRFASLESSLEQKLKQYVETLIQGRFAELAALSPKKNLDLILEKDDRKPFARTMPIPTIRPLQVGDRVLVLEPDSPYYMAKLLVVRTSLIRATVETETGEKTFLKRDLRFVETANSANE